jgi:CRISPR/Cas system-associated exonuclease Cas4 (RecB family)
MKEFFFTQTAVKDLEKDETCPFRWKEQWIEGNVPFSSNPAMDKGKYFEQLILGSGAIAGDEILDLPRLKNGEKSAEHQRIEQQAERAEKMLFDEAHPEYLGLKYVDCQVDLRVGNRKGTVDIEMMDKDGTIWLIDLKLTSDASSTRSKYSWGNDWDTLDLIQMVHYHDLYYKHTGKEPRVALLVFDYSTKRQVIFNEVVINEKKQQELQVRFETAEIVVNLYKENGWVKTPNYSECKKCPLTCNERFN